MNVRSPLCFFWWIIFCTDCFTVGEKMRKIYSVIRTQIPFILALRLSLRWFQMPLKALSFLKKLATFGIIYATDPLLQSTWLRSFASMDSPSIFFTIYTLADYAELRAPIFLKSGYFPDALPLKQSQWSPIIFAILTQVTR